MPTRPSHAPDASPAAVEAERLAAEFFAAPCDPPPGRSPRPKKRKTLADCPDLLFVLTFGLLTASLAFGALALDAAENPRYRPSAEDLMSAPLLPAHVAILAAAFCGTVGVGLVRGWPAAWLAAVGAAAIALLSPIFAVEPPWPSGGERTVVSLAYLVVLARPVSLRWFFPRGALLGDRRSTQDQG